MERMLASKSDETRLVGTYDLIRESFYDEKLGRRLDKILSVPGPARRIAAHLAAHHLPWAEYVERAKSILEKSFCDEDEKVRFEAADCFRHIKAEEFGQHHVLARAFVKSPAFGMHDWAFLNALKNATSDVTELVITTGERSIQNWRTKPAQSSAQADLHTLVPLMQAAYEGCREEPEFLRRALDVIDDMLEMALYGAENIVNAHERM